MKNISFNSSNLNSATYDDITNVLTIRFNTGDTYNYFGVPQVTVNELEHAASAGSYFHSFIREKFQYKRV